jgi:hypothetical protein
VQVAHVGIAQVEIHSGSRCALTCLRKHRGRRIQSDHRAASRQRNRDRHSAASNGEFDERPIGFPRELDVERDVRSHLGRPLVVTMRKGLVPAHHQMLRRLRAAGY